MEPDKTGSASAFAVLLLGGALTSSGSVLADGHETSADAAGLPGLVGIGVTAFGTLVLAWWAMSFCCAIAVELLIRRGRLKAARRIGAFAPGFMRRAACLALGMNLVAVPAAYAGTGFTQSSVSERLPAAEEASILSPLWEPVQAGPVLEPSWRPTALPPGGSLLVKEARESRPSTATAQDEVVVRPGDSLWTIAARQLGPDASDMAVAEAWPRWYEANRDVIGANPELLQPGQILHPPTATPPVTQ